MIFRVPFKLCLLCLYNSVFKNLKFYYSNNPVLWPKWGSKREIRGLCLPKKSVVPLSACICPPHLLHPDVYSSRNHSTSLAFRQCGQLILADLLLCLLGKKNTPKSQLSKSQTGWTYNLREGKCPEAVPRGNPRGPKDRRPPFDTLAALSGTGKRASVAQVLSFSHQSPDTEFKVSVWTGWAGRRKCGSEAHESCRGRHCGLDRPQNTGER